MQTVIVFSIIVLVGFSLRDADGRSITLSVKHRENFAVNDIVRRDVIEIPDVESDLLVPSRERRSGAWASDDKTPEKSWMNDDNGDKGFEVEHAKTESFMARYGVFVITPIVVVFLIINMIICYKLCYKRGICFCCSVKKIGQNVAGKYMAGVRKDSKGELYMDEITAEEADATKALVGM